MIRLADYGDLNEIYQLVCEMEQSELNFESCKQIITQQLGDPNHFCWVWEEDGAVVGCLNLRAEYQLHHAARIAEITELAVKEGFRSRGIGKQLFDHACFEMRKSGCAQIEVCCNLLRERAHSFYKRQGMNRFHDKFSMSLNGEPQLQNRLGV